MLAEEQALELLNQGDVVAIPTETVYGLAARIDSEQGLKKIFAVKERPFFDPLIVHVASAKMAQSYCRVWTELHQRLADSFWPGPLTMVVPKSPEISDLITSSLTTVGLRCPNHPLSLQLIEKIGVGLAAPSANKFSKTSPTCAEHVAESLPQVEVLNGGECKVGIESTIVSIETGNINKISILRPGMVSLNEIQKCLREFKVEFIEKSATTISPGSLEDHYMPDAPLVLQKDLRIPESQLLERVNKEMQSSFQQFKILDLPTENYLAARYLYSNLRQPLNKSECCWLYRLEAHTQVDDWQPILDRLTKASSLII